jgi:uncharacterized membrane protein
MDWVTWLRWAHVIGACVLLGTGAGIAFFMLMAHRTKDAAFIAHTSRIVIVADYLFTLSAVVAQPLTGAALASALGWPLFEGWVALSLILYVFTGAFWIPVVWIQHRLHTLAADAHYRRADLPPEYHRLFRIWFLCGFPAFGAVLTIVWLMLARPEISWFG